MVDMPIATVGWCHQYPAWWSYCHPSPLYLHWYWHFYPLSSPAWVVQEWYQGQIHQGWWPLTKYHSGCLCHTSQNCSRAPYNCHPPFLWPRVGRFAPCHAHKWAWLRPWSTGYPSKINTNGLVSSVTLRVIPSPISLMSLGIIVIVWLYNQLTSSHLLMTSLTAVSMLPRTTACLQTPLSLLHLRNRITGPWGPFLDGCLLT